MRARSSGGARGCRDLEVGQGVLQLRAVELVVRAAAREVLSCSSSVKFVQV